MAASKSEVIDFIAALSEDELDELISEARSEDPPTPDKKPRPAETAGVAKGRAAYAARRGGGLK